jgi:hypothetical protein
LYFLQFIGTFVTGWMGENHFASVPTAAYGVVLLFAAIAYYVLQSLIKSEEGSRSGISLALGADLKGKFSAHAPSHCSSDGICPTVDIRSHLCVCCVVVADSRQKNRIKAEGEEE